MWFLYKQRYYLYHGAAPALLLFAPWYLLTGHDLPENFAAFLLALGGYSFYRYCSYGYFGLFLAKSRLRS